MSRSVPPFAVFFVAVLMAQARPAVAQSSRAEAIAAQQAEKARTLKPYEPNKAERIIETIENKFLLTPSGFFPTTASVYSGGGFTLGAGYRQMFGDHASWHALGMYSLSAYKLVETGITSPGHARGKLDLSARVGWRDATQVSWYGVGQGTTTDDKTNFRFQEAFARGAATWRPAFPVVFGGAVTLHDFTEKPGTGTTPSIETEFDDVTAPGLGRSPRYLHSEGTAALDWRPSPGYARTGGYWGATYHAYADQDGSQSFDRIDADVVQHLPLLRETWVISLHGGLQTIVNDDDQVPYFLLPSLGSGSTLRAYPSWRFRDRHALLMQGEFRWIPNRLGLDMAIFYDAGKVTSRREDLSFEGLAHDWGFGVRMHGPMQTPLRIEIARGSEGWNLVFAGSAAF